MRRVSQRMGTQSARCARPPIFKADRISFYRLQLVYQNGTLRNMMECPPLFIPRSDMLRWGGNPIVELTLCRILSVPPVQDAWDYRAAIRPPRLLLPYAAVSIPMRTVRCSSARNAATASGRFSHIRDGSAAGRSTAAAASPASRSIAKTKGAAESVNRTRP